MQKFRLIQVFREWAIGTIFTRHADGEWSSVGEFAKQPSHVLDTLQDVGGYLEETANVFTPNNGDTFFYITGAGEIKSKEWTNSDWCQSARDFMGIFETHEEAEIRLTEVNTLLDIN